MSSKRQQQKIPSTRPPESTLPVHPCNNLFETVIVPHGRAIAANYPIPAGCRREFIGTGWVGAQKVDIYRILKKQGGNNEEETA